MRASYQRWVYRRRPLHCFLPRYCYLIRQVWAEYKTNGRNSEPGNNRNGCPIFLTILLPFAGGADFAGTSSSLEEPPLSLELPGDSTCACAMD